MRSRPASLPPTLNLAMTLNTSLPHLDLSFPFEPQPGKNPRLEWARLQGGGKRGVGPQPPEISSRMIIPQVPEPVNQGHSQALTPRGAPDQVSSPTALIPARGLLHLLLQRQEHWPLPRSRDD